MGSSNRPTVMRGEVWIVALDPVIGSEQAKARPCVVVQRDAANHAGRTTIVVPITDASGQSANVIKPLLLAGDGGLSKDSVALCRQIRVVDTLRFRSKLGSLKAESASAVSRGLVEILDLESGD